MATEDQAIKVLVELTRLQNPFASISPQNGRFLSILVRATKAKSVLEIGTGNGFSSLFLGYALKDTGGKLLTIEIDPNRVAIAKENIKRAGLDDVIEITQGDAHQIVPKLDEEFDFIFLDADHRNNHKYLDELLPKLRVGGLLLADDQILLARQTIEYTDRVRKDPNLISVLVPIDDGVEMTYKRK